MAKNDKKINEILDGMLSSNNRLAGNYRKFNIEKIWRETFGETISKYTDKVYLRDKKLTVYLSSAPMRQELTYRQEKIVSRLNANLKYLQIDSVVFK